MKKATLKINLLFVTAVLISIGATVQVTVGSDKIPEKFSVPELISNESTGISSWNINKF